MTIGTNTVSAIYIGTNEVLRITDGQGRVLYESVVPPAPTDDTPYMTFTATAANTLIRATHNGTNQTTTKPVFYKSTDKVTWEQWDTDMYIRLTNIGDKVYLYGENPNGIGRSSANYTNINLAGGAAEISGDITTLLTRYGNVSIPSYGFYKLFYNVQYTGTAEFGHQGCGNLSVGANGCASMFEEGRLTSADMHYITSLANTACNSMFLRDSTFNYMYAPSVQSWDTNKTSNWLQSVSLSGTFKIDTYAIVPSGSSGCPTSWTKQLPNKNLTLSAIGTNDTWFYWGQGANPTYTLSVGSTVSTSLSQNGKITIQTGDWQYPICKNGVRCTPMAGMAEMYQFTYNDVADNDTITATYANYSNIYVNISCDIQSQTGMQPDYFTDPSNSSQILNYTDYATVQVWEPDTLFVNYDIMACDLYLNGEKQTDNSWTYAQLEAIGNVNIEIMDKTTEIHFVNNTQSGYMDATENDSQTQLTIQAGGSDTMSLVGDQWGLNIYGHDGGGGSVDLLLNGVSQGSDSATFHFYDLSDGDTITLVDV